MIGFDRSALVANPACGTGNQNVNRVVAVRFMTKVFRSILSKIRTEQAFDLLVLIIAKQILANGSETAQVANLELVRFGQRWSMRMRLSVRPNSRSVSLTPRRRFNS